ncbi:EamA family transporter [Patescibacteria group bacterium]|nr:EamA family transporter [Patescibacteria group bacterium]
MGWIFIAIFAYFLIALQTILDKFLLTSNRVSHPATYTFFVGLMSIFTFILFPLGFHLIGAEQFVLSIISGIIFIYGIFCLFTAIEKSEASRVTPVIGSVIPIITLILAMIFLGERLSAPEIGGIFLLIFGGIFISLEFFPKSLEPKKLFSGFYLTVMAGMLIAVAFIVFKYLYGKDNFINVFIWTRMGLFLGALSLLLFPFWRKIILKSFHSFNHPQKENRRTGFLFVANKILGGVGSVLIHLAVSLGSVAIVNALVAVEYVFIFILGLTLSLKFPAIFQEKKTARNVLQKTLGIGIIISGIVLISI